MMGCMFLAVALKVLTIGNSYSECTIREFPAVAADLGVELDLLNAFIGGCPLEKQIRLMDNPSLDKHVRPWCCKFRYCDGMRPDLPNETWNFLADAIKADRWDVITIQQASAKSWKRESYSPWGGELIGRIRLLAPQAEIVLQETWSDMPGSGRLDKWDVSSEDMYASLHAAYSDFAKIHGLRIIPTGTAVERARHLAQLQKKVNDPHLNATGEFLQALVWTEKLFGKDVTQGKYVPKGMDPALAAKLRAVAHAVVSEQKADRE